MTRLLVLPGDGIGPEVTAACLQVLERLVPAVEVLHGQAGRTALADHGQPLAPAAQAHISGRQVDGVLFGATETRPGEPSAVLALRRAAGSRVSIRPARQLLPEGRACHVTVYRELTEDLYVQDERRTGEGAVALRPITRSATAIFARLSLDHLPEEVPAVVAHKATILPETDGLFLGTVRQVAEDRGRALGDRLVDALAHDLAMDASGPVAILAPNLYGDLLSDLTAGLAGGLGLAPSLTLGDGAPIAEPVHGTAPDIAGQGTANPTAALLSTALLLDELGYPRQAHALESAVHRALARPETRTPDVGGQGTTGSFTDHVVATLEVVA